MLRRTTPTRFVEPISFKNDILFMNPVHKPSMSREYGQRAQGFFVSPIQSFQGKMWQLRTVRLNCQHFVVPFIINGGGISATQPILGSPLVKRIGADRSNPNRTLCLETPIGNLHTFSEWDNERDADTLETEEGIMFNLIGHGLADLLQCVKAYSGQILHGDALTPESAVRVAIRDARDDVKKHTEQNEQFVRRELEETVKAMKLAQGPLAGVQLHEWAGRAGWLMPEA
jgi:hypothetical protein